METVRLLHLYIYTILKDHTGEKVGRIDDTIAMLSNDCNHMNPMSSLVHDALQELITYPALDSTFIAAVMYICLYILRMDLFLIFSFASRKCALTLCTCWRSSVM